MTMTKPTSEQVTFTAAGSGATLRNLVDKVREVVSVKDFGAVGDGIANDLPAIQAAINSIELAGGGALYFPPGIYQIDNASAERNGILISSSNIMLFGCGMSSQIRQTSNIQHMIAVDGRAARRSNIIIRDLYLNGPTVRVPYPPPPTPLPQEHYHTIMLVNCEDVHIAGNTIAGFNGDGIDIDAAFKSEGSPPYSTLRRNARILIENNRFDGIDNRNRNGVSVIMGTDIVIRNNSFANISNQYMPGSVDIESNPSAYYVLNDIVVENNHFENSQGFLGHIGLVLPANSFASGSPFRNFSFRNNQFNGTGRGISVLNGSDIELHLSITGNVYDGTAAPIIIGYGNYATYARQVRVAGNIFRYAGANNPPIFGIKHSAAEDIVRDIVISGNIFDGTTQLGSGPFVGGTLTRAVISGNEFQNMLDYGLRIGAALTGSVSEVSDVSITGNVFHGIAGAGLSVLGGPQPNPNAASCVYMGNQHSGGTNSCRFPSSKFIDYSSASPTGGTHAVGATSINIAPAIGSPKAWRCTVAGTPGTWVSEGNL